MKASTKRILSILLSAVFLIALVVVITSLVKPEFGRVMEKRAELYSKQQIFDKQKEAVEKVDSLIQEIQSFDKLRNAVSLAIPLNPEVPKVLNQIDAIARTSDVNIPSFESEPKPFEGGDQTLTRRLGVLGLNFTARGDYQNLKNFLRFIESNVRVFDVKGLNLSRRDIGGGQIDYSLSIEAETFYQEGNNN